MPRLALWGIERPGDDRVSFILRQIMHSIFKRRFGTLVRSELADALRSQYGIVAPNALQRDALQSALTGKDMLLVAQTGSGKTLCFLLPLLERLAASARTPSLGLVLAPSRELAMQHAGVAAMLADAMPGGPVVQLLSRDQPFLQSSKATAARLLVAQPEVALDLLRKGVIDATQLTALAIDEVDAVLCGGPFEHRLSSAGESLLEALDVPTTTLCAPPRRQSLLATAHLTPAHEAALRGRFGAYTRVEQRSEGGRRPGTLVPSLKQVFHYTSGSKDEKLLTVLRRARADEWLRDGATLVFCANGATVERLRAVVMEAEKAYSEAELSTLSPPSPPPPRPLLPPLPPLILHEGLADDERHAALSALRRSAADADVEAPSRAPRVLIATSVVARGLDVPGLRHVILYDMPTDIAGYVHCAGRTARGGRPGLVSCLVESHSQAGRFRELHALTRAPALHFGG